MSAKASSVRNDVDPDPTPIRGGVDPDPASAEQTSTAAAAATLRRASSLVMDEGQRRLANGSTGLTPSLLAHFAGTSEFSETAAGTR